MRHNDCIIVPYAVADTFTNFAAVKIDGLMKLLHG
jgi:hypothetical protein